MYCADFGTCITTGFLCAYEVTFRVGSHVKSEAKSTIGVDFAAHFTCGRTLIGAMKTCEEPISNK